MVLGAKRKRAVYLGMFVAVVSLGLLSRSNLISFPGFISRYAGDVLWAIAVFLLICFIFPCWRPHRIAIAALLFSFAIEFSQFYRSPWINEIRRTLIGGWVLGFGFKSSDLACYAVGVAIGSIVDLRLETRVDWTQVSDRYVQEPLGVKIYKSFAS